MFYIKGKVSNIGEEKSGTSKNGNTWKSRNIVVEYLDENGEEQIIYINLFNINIDLTIGCTVSVKFSIKGKEWNGKFFNNIYAEDISVISENNGKNIYHSNKPANNITYNKKQKSSDDKLPF